MSIWDNITSAFNANAPAGSPGSYQALETRRKIALQMLANQRKGYPKNIGEGLTAIGDAIGERGAMRAMEAQQAAFDKYNAEHAPPDVNTLLPQDGATPPAARPQASAAPPPGPPVASAAPATDQAPIQTAELAPEERTGGVVGTEFNPLDAAAPTATAAAAPTGYRAAPSYLQAALDANIPDPVRRAYLGQLAGKEAQSANEVSPTGASGPFQFTRGTGRQYGLIDSTGDHRTDPAASVLAVNKFTDDNAKVLEKGLGRPPTPGELALAHQQGARTAVAMLTGAGNAPSRNLAVNNVSPGTGPQAAARKIMAYYNMPGGAPGGAPPAAAQVASAAPPPGPPGPPPMQMSPGGPPPGPGGMSPGDAQQAALLGDVTGMGSGDRDYSYPQTASLGRTGDVASDVPDASGVGPGTGAAVADTVMQTRDAMARAMTPQQPMPAPGVPQPNPTLGGITPPTTGPGPDTGIRAAPQPPQIQLAQNGGPPPVQAGGAPQIPEINRVTPPVAMPDIARVPDQPESTPRNRAEIEGARTLQLGIQQQNPVLVDRGNLLLKLGKEARDKADADNLAAWQAQKETERQRQLATEAAQRGKGVAQQQLLQEQAKAAEAQRTNRFGGAPAYQQFVGDLVKSYDATQQLANTMPTLRQAKQSLAQSYTGAGAELKLDANKMLRTLGVPGDYTPEVATEMLRSRMKAIAGGMLKSTVGGSNISDADRDFVEAAAVGKINMEPESIRRLLNAAEETTIRSINRHNDRLIGVTQNPDDRMLRDQYQVPMQYGNEATTYLKAHPETAPLFDKKFGAGHAKAILQGTVYGQ